MPGREVGRESNIPREWLDTLRLRARIDRNCCFCMIPNGIGATSRCVCAAGGGGLVAFGLAPGRSRIIGTCFPGRRGFHVEVHYKWNWGERGSRSVAARGRDSPPLAANSSQPRVSRQQALQAVPRVRVHKIPGWRGGGAQGAYRRGG